MIVFVVLLVFVFVILLVFIVIISILIFILYTNVVQATYLKNVLVFLNDDLDDNNEDGDDGIVIFVCGAS